MIVVKKLQDIVNIKSGIYVKESLHGEVCCLQVKDFDANGQVIFPLEARIDLTGNVRNHLLKKGDLLFAAKGVNNFCTIFRTEMSPAVASSSFLVLSIKDSDVLPEYLCWFFNRSDVFSYFRNRTAGSVMPSISKTMLEDYLLEIPSVGMQEKIVSIISLQKHEQNLYKKIVDLRTKVINNQIINILKNDKNYANRY